MANRRPSHAKELYYILCFAFALGIILLGLFGGSGYLEMRRHRQELADQRVRVEEMQRALQDQLARIERLKNDPAALEEYLRRQGYARADELIQEVPPDRTSPPQPR